MKPLKKAIEELGGKKFLNITVENKLDSLFNNVILIVPTDDVVEDFLIDMKELVLI